MESSHSFNYNNQLKRMRGRTCPCHLSWTRHSLFFLSLCLLRFDLRMNLWEHTKDSLSPYDRTDCTGIAFNFSTRKVAAFPEWYREDQAPTGQLNSLAAIKTDNEYTVFFCCFSLEVSIQPLIPCLGIHHFWHSVCLRSRMKFQESIIVRIADAAPFMKDFNPGLTVSGFQ